MQYPKPYIKGNDSSVILTILQAVAEISKVLRHSPVLVLQTTNKFGDQQLHQDVYCDQIVQKHLRKNQIIKGFASQQRPDYIQISQGEGYVVTYDPLDGSSIIDTNFTVGSIFSIWPTTKQNLVGQKLSHQTNAILSLYGPRTTAIFYNRQSNKVQQLTLIDDIWILSHQHLVIKPKTKMFSPGNLRAVNDNPQYHKIVDDWIHKEYTLRYTGGLVPDVCQIFVKGHGVISNVSSEKHKAKLRVLYQVAAVGFLIQKAQGKTVTIGRISLMDYQVTSYDDRMQLIEQIRSFAAGSAQQIQTLKSIF